MGIEHYVCLPSYVSSYSTAILCRVLLFSFVCVLYLTDGRRTRPVAARALSPGVAALTVLAYPMARVPPALDYLRQKGLQLGCLVIL